MKNLAKNPIKKLLAIVTIAGAASTSAIAAPRTLPSGAPAPGNTVAKGDRSDVRQAERAVDRARRHLAEAIAEEKDAKQQLVANPRTLPSGAPACGNTGGKAPACTEEVANARYQARIERVKAAEKAVARAKAKLHEATRKVALLRSGDGDDYS